jgi:hypothetical protein
MPREDWYILRDIIQKTNNQNFALNYFRLPALHVTR